MGPIAQQPGSGEAGFTIVEVMVAMAVLLVGVLATLVLIEGSFASTSATTAHEQGTNLARDLVERSREAAYADITMGGARAALQATLPASDAAATVSSSTFTAKVRNITYTVKVFACSIDDPTDGAGVGNATFCEAPDITHHPGSPPSGPAAAVNVLGVAVSLGGSLLNTVCNAVGTNTDILNALTAAVSVVAPLSACPATATGTVPYDTQPDDLRRVRVDVSWDSSHAQGSVSQTTLLTNPLQS